MALPKTKAGSSDHDSFIKESWITAQLDHPNIINIHEIGVNEDDLPFFTMDLRTGDNLENILRKLKEGDPDYIERFPRKVLLEMFIKICDAIAYAHSINILHLYKTTPGLLQQSWFFFLNSGFEVLDTQNIRSPETVVLLFGANLVERDPPSGENQI